MTEQLPDCRVLKNSLFEWNISTLFSPMLIGQLVNNQYLKAVTDCPPVNLADILGIHAEAKSVLNIKCSI